MAPRSPAALLLVVASIATQADTVSSFSPVARDAAAAIATTASSSAAARTTILHAMERLHDPSANPYRNPSNIEHVYTTKDIDVVTRLVRDDEWTALGSVIAETMFETILDVGDEALKRRGWVDRMALTDRIAEDVSSSVEVS